MCSVLLDIVAIMGFVETRQANVCLMSEREKTREGRGEVRWLFGERLRLGLFSVAAVAVGATLRV